MDANEEQVSAAFRDGLKAGDGAAESLRLAREAAPDDMVARARLLGALQRTRGNPQKPAPEFVEECLWWIVRHPENEMTGQVSYFLCHAPFPVYSRARDTWNSVLKDKGEDATVLLNAGKFFQHQEPERTDSLWRKAHDLAVTDYRPASMLGLAELQSAMRYEASGGSTLDQAQCQRALNWFLTSLGRATTDEQRDFVLHWACNAALGADDLDCAQRFGEQLLAIASDREPSKKTGNAFFIGHTTLGRVALARGDVDLARTHLLQSGQSPGSPNLDSFGPEFVLADQLLAKGEREAVLTFLRGCAKFWKMDRGRLATWQTMIERGETPKLNRHG